jgi:hypothetical protein
MVIKITDHISHCSSNDDGKKIFDLIMPVLKAGGSIRVSFKEVDSLTSSFINSAFIELLNDFSFDYIKANLRFIDTNNYINRMIKKRFDFETSHRQKMEANRDRQIANAYNPVHCL